jgi:hypothetical protein
MQYPRHTKQEGSDFVMSESLDSDSSSSLSYYDEDGHYHRHDYEAKGLKIQKL